MSQAMIPKRRADLRQRGFFGAVALAVALYVLWLMVMSGGVAKPGTGYEISAVLPTAGAQLVSGARVTMAGVEVGSVSGVERRGSGAVVRLRLTDAAVVPLPATTRAQLRSRTPLGENYISLLPGRGGPTLAEGAVIPLAQAVDSVDVDEVLSVLRGPARARARQLIRGVGSAVDGRGRKLNALVGSASGTVDSGAVLVDTLYGQREQVSRLVDQLGAVATRLGERDQDIRTIARRGTQTFRAIAAQDDDLRTLARELPSTLAQIRRTTGKLGATSDVAAPVLGRLASTITAAKPAVRSLRPGATHLRRVVDELGAATPRLRATLGALRRVSGPVAKTLPGAEKALCEVNPILRYTKPYVADLVGVLTGLSSASNAYDAVGHTIRLAATINETALVGLPDDLNVAANTLLHSGLLSKSNGATFIPFPGPKEGHRTAEDYPRVSGPGEVRTKANYTYPRITADC